MSAPDGPTAQPPSPEPGAPRPPEPGPGWEPPPAGQPSFEAPPGWGPPPAAAAPYPPQNPWPQGPPTPWAQAGPQTPWPQGQPAPPWPPAAPGPQAPWPPSATWPPIPAPAPVACYRHPQSPAGVRCQRCGRPICGACMVEAPVGFQCPDCVAQGAKETRQDVAPYGGRRSRDPRTSSIAIIATNVAVWVAITLGGGVAGSLFNLFALSPLSTCRVPGGYYPGLDAAGCASYGGDWSPGMADGAWWQLLTSAFTHASMLHIGFNMFALWVLGPQLERVLGRTRFLALYLLSGLAGSVAVYWLSDPSSTTIGASGAVFGLMGALLVLAARAGGDVRTILFWLGANVAITFLGGSNISWQGHLGGLAGGLLVTFLVVALRRNPRALGLALGGVGAGLALLVAARTLLLA